MQKQEIEKNDNLKQTSSAQRNFKRSKNFSKRRFVKLSSYTLIYFLLKLSNTLILFFNISPKTKRLKEDFEHLELTL